MVVGIAGASGMRTASEKLGILFSEIIKLDWLMKNLIINILEAAAFLLLGLGVSLLG